MDWPVGARPCADRLRCDNPLTDKGNPQGSLRVEFYLIKDAAYAVRQKGSQNAFLVQTLKSSPIRRPNKRLVTKRLTANRTRPNMPIALAI